MQSPSSPQPIPLPGPSLALSDPESLPVLVVPVSVPAPVSVLVVPVVAPGPDDELESTTIPPVELSVPPLDVSPGTGPLVVVGVPAEELDESDVLTASTGSSPHALVRHRPRTPTAGQRKRVTQTRLPRRVHWSRGGATGKLGSVTAAADPRDALFELLEGAVREGVFPGAVATIYRRGAIVYDEGHGALATDRRCSVHGIEVGRDTVYDLASLTKVLATTTMVAQLVSEGRLDLEAPVPEPWHRACPDATLADLLEHCSGLQAHREYFTSVEPFDADKLLHQVLATPRGYERRTKAVYSDLGFIILGAWLERELDEPLDKAFADRVAYRLGLDDHVMPAIGYRRVFSEAALGWELERKIAPTELYAEDLYPDGVPSYFRVRKATGIAHGVVHDDNAYVMGGVAGHAGLFGTAAAVMEIARAWVEGILPGVDRQTRDRFWQRSTVPGSTRCLGWDGVSRDGSGMTGRAMSEHAVGHSGFTGTSVWIDPDPNEGPWIAVLLTNRVHPKRDHDPIKAFRPEFHEAAAKLR